MATLAEQFGAMVRHHRERSGMSQQELGDKVDRTAVTVGRIERGESATTIESLDSFATALGVSVRDLFGVGEFEAREGREDAMVDIVRKLAPLDEDQLKIVGELIDVALKLKR